MRVTRTRHLASPRNRATVLVAVLVALLIISVAVLSLGTSNALNQQTTADRTEGARTFYANEAIANMSMRELVNASDYDGDGDQGAISDDGNAANNPTINGVSGMATRSVSGSNITITCTAASTNTLRKIVLSLTQ
jgi:Tfp pilus assembly protein PilX